MRKSLGLIPVGGLSFSLQCYDTLNSFGLGVGNFCMESSVPYRTFSRCSSHWLSIVYALFESFVVLKFWSQGTENPRKLSQPNLCGFS